MLDNCTQVCIYLETNTASTCLWFGSFEAAKQQDRTTLTLKQKSLILQEIRSFVRSFVGICELCASEYVARIRYTILAISFIKLLETLLLLPLLLYSFEQQQQQQY